MHFFTLNLDYLPEKGSLYSVIFEMNPMYTISLKDDVCEITEKGRGCGYVEIGGLLFCSVSVILESSCHLINPFCQKEICKIKDSHAKLNYCTISSPSPYSFKRLHFEN